MCPAPRARIVVASFNHRSGSVFRSRGRHDQTIFQKMVDRLTGKDALNPPQLARESGLCQQSLSRWLQEARSPPLVGSDKHIERWRVALAEDGQGSVATTKRIPSWPAKTTRWLKRPHSLGRPAAKTPLSHPGEQLRASRAKSGVLVSASFKSNLARGKSARPVQDNSKSRSKSRKTPA
jgi:hypothetical protein